MKFKFSFIALSLLACQLWAKPVTGLYDARVPVPNQQVDSRQLAAKQGLLEVLQKVSGFAVPADNEAIERAMAIADQYLYQYSYQAVHQDEWDASIPPGSSWLKMQFEAQSIQKIIKRANLPLWGNNRPTVLLWLMKDERGRSVLVDGAEGAMANAVKYASDKRGVPVVLPLYDLEDAIRLPQESLWGLFSDPILEASQRYGSESVMAGRIYMNSQAKWVGQWRFYFKDREFSYDYESESLNLLLLSAFSYAGEVLANTYAIKPSDETNDVLAIKVTNVKNLKHYAALVGYLEGLTITKNVFVASLKGSDLELRLTLSGSLAQLNQVLTLDRKLIQVKQDEAAMPPSDVDPLIPQLIQYKWQP